METKPQNNDLKIDKELWKLDRTAIIIGIIGLIAMIISPMLFTQFHLFFDFNNTGQIGDTIGGLTSPIIGFFSAALIYFSFRAQIKANYIVQIQINRQRKEEDEKKEFTYQIQLFNHIKESINDFKYINGYKEINEKFIGLRELLKDMPKSNLDPDYFFFVNDLLSVFDSEIESIERSNNKNYDTRFPLLCVEKLFRQEIWNKSGKYIQSYLRSNENECYNSRVFDIFKRINEINSKFVVLTKS